MKYYNLALQFISFTLLVSLVIGCSSVSKNSRGVNSQIKSVEYPKILSLEVIGKENFVEESKKVFLAMESPERDFFVNDYYLKGVDLKENGQPKLASRVFKVLHDLIPFDDSVRKNLIVSFIRSNQLEEAELTLNKIINNESGDNVNFKLILAGLQNARGEMELSKKTYRDILQFDPANEEACIFLSRALSNEGESGDSIKLLKSCLKSNPTSSTFLFYLGKSYLEKKNKKKADNLFRRALDNEPAFYQAVVARALIKEQSGNLKGALKILKNYLEKVDFENYAILTRATQIMFELNMIEEITPYLEEMLRQDPENLNLKVRLGIIYSETSSFSKAKNIFETILKKVPDSDRVLYYLGALYQQTKNPDKAIDYYSRIQPTSNLYFDSNLQIGLMVREKSVSMKNISQGIKGISELKERIPLTLPKRSELIRELDFYISYLKHDFEDYSGALVHLSTIYKNEDYTIEQKFFVASLHEKLKDFKSAIELMMGVIQKDPKNAHALNFVGYVMLENTGEVKGAYDYIKRAVELEPNDSYIRDSLGWYFYKRGDLKRALVEVKKAWQGEKKDVVITKHLAIIYQKMNNRDQAKKYFIEALKNCQKHAEKLDIIKSMDQQILKRLPASIRP